WGHCNYTKAYYLDSDGTSKICPQGYYCQNNTKKPCEGVTYTDLEGLSECKTCPYPNEYQDKVHAGYAEGLPEHLYSIWYYTDEDHPIHSTISQCYTAFAVNIKNSDTTIDNADNKKALVVCGGDKETQDYGIASPSNSEERIDCWVMNVTCDEKYHIAGLGNGARENAASQNVWIQTTEIRNLEDIETDFCVKDKKI
ncbi:MAG: hypothetical protein MJ158_04440, partial [Alphaproteobacteria bacterium]|nr:hypothetical protein [Alphaproteobacteria bacterium]